MDHFSVDIETFSSVDIKKAGLYKYVQSPDFEVLLFAYSYNSQPVILIDVTAMPIPEHIIDALLNPNIIKHAYNASFEWYCLSKYIFQNYPQKALNAFDWVSQWRCTMAHGLYCGYPAGLTAIGEALGLPQDKRKLGTGMSLIRTFCIPQKPTLTNGRRTRTRPVHEPEKWELFKTYCKQDVATEMAVEKKLSAWPLPLEEQYLWELDQKINAHGVRVDQELIASALYVSEKVTAELMAEAKSISGLDNPKSIKQLLDWLQTELEDEEISDLQKKTVADLLGGELESPNARRMLELRQELGKTSVTKYTAMSEAVCADSRVRGLFQYYGANRTGRWAGRLVQVQNLPRNYLDSLELARDLVKRRRIQDLKWIYGNIPDTLSQLIRTAFIPAENHTFLVADFSAIEARVLAWLAGETWRQEVFATHGKIYEASVSAMFGVPLDLIVKGNPEYALRQKGKIAELALGYGGAKGALITMGALDMGLTEDELPDIVSRWRQANRRIVDFWYAAESAALTAVTSGVPTSITPYGITFAREIDRETGQDFLTVALPSGRKLFYVKPHIGKNQWNNDSLHYFGNDQKTKKWSSQETYGGKLVENITQAIARDCLAEAMHRIADNGHSVPMHVHDEVVIEASEGYLDQICGLVSASIPWAPGLKLCADGYATPYYKKD